MAQCTDLITAILRKEIVYSEVDRSGKTWLRTSSDQLMDFWLVNDLWWIFKMEIIYLYQKRSRFNISRPTKIIFVWKISRSPDFKVNSIENGLKKTKSIENVKSNRNCEWTVNYKFNWKNVEIWWPREIKHSAYISSYRYLMCIIFPFARSTWLFMIVSHEFSVTSIACSKSFCI